MPVVSGILQRIGTEILQPAAQVVFAAGFLLFLWGLVKFLWNAQEGADNAEGKSHMIWGIVGMVIMVSIWGIISLLNNTFGLGVNGGASTDPGNIQIQQAQFINT
jgi:hypothetical protein